MRSERNHKKTYIYGLGVGLDNYLTLQVPEKIKSIKEMTEGDFGFDFSDIRYIGSTVSNLSRLNEHFEEIGKSNKNQWINELREIGKMPFMRIFCSCDNNLRDTVEDSFINAFVTLLPDQCVNTAIRRTYDPFIYKSLITWGKTSNDFPIIYNNEKYHRNQCASIFLDFYGGNGTLNHNGGAYMTDGMFVYPNGFIDNK